MGIRDEGKAFGDSGEPLEVIPCGADRSCVETGVTPPLRTTVFGRGAEDRELTVAA